MQRTYYHYNAAVRFFLDFGLFQSSKRITHRGYLHDELFLRIHIAERTQFTTHELTSLYHILLKYSYLQKRSNLYPALHSLSSVSRLVSDKAICDVTHYVTMPPAPDWNSMNCGLITLSAVSEQNLLINWCFVL